MTGTNVFGIAVGTGTTFVLGSSYARKGIIFHPPANNRITLGNDAVVTLDQGPTLQQTQGPLVLREDVHGDIVKMPWNAVSNVAGTFIGVTEIYGEWPLGPADSQTPGLQSATFPHYLPSPISNNPSHS